MSDASAEGRTHRITIAAHRAISVQASVGTVIRCVSGRVWLTQENDVRDYCVAAGVTFCADRRGRVVLMSLEHESTVLVEPAPARGAGGVPGTLRIHSLEQLERQARRARAAYLGDAFAAVVKRVADALARVARRCRYAEALPDLRVRSARRDDTTAR